MHNQKIHLVILHGSSTRNEATPIQLQQVSLEKQNIKHKGNKGQESVKKLKEKNNLKEIKTT